MEPNIAWLDLTASDRDKMQRVLDLFKEPGTVDEMGLGSLREALSTILFPGITSIQTRLRYVLFVPWIYRSMERRRIPANRVTEELRRMEVQLIAPLAKTEEQGVIGVSARHKLQRLPSSVYWGVHSPLEYLSARQEPVLVSLAVHSTSRCGRVRRRCGRPRCSLAWTGKLASPTAGTSEGLSRGGDFRPHGARGSVHSRTDRRSLCR